MRLTINGIGYHIRSWGQGPALLALHGFTGSGASWGALASSLGGTRNVIAPDLIGHGATDAPADPGRYAMPACVADLLALADALGIKQFDLLGYSMGGRLALQLAAAAPQRVRRMALESASPGLASQAERQARRAADDALAERIEREGLAWFASYWQAIPLFASQAALPAEALARLREQRLACSPHGLAGSLRGMGTGQQTSLWDALGRLPTLTLLLAGALDAKFTAIGQQMAERMPQAQLAIIPDAGHTIHLEQPSLFAEAVAAFLDEK